jgi:hypothetical protein
LDTKQANYRWLETTLDLDEDQTALNLLAEINDVLDSLSPDLMFMLLPSKHGIDVALMKYNPKKGKHFLKSSR